MSRVIKLLADQGIQAIPYKGKAYAQQFYGDLVSRESSDIDLIIRPQELSKIIKIMEAEGYQCANKKAFEYLESKYFEYYKDLGCEKFKNGEREFYIEFHWAITANVFDINPHLNSFIYQADEKIEIANQPINALNGNVHFLFILVHHAIADVFHSLREIVDIAQFVYQQRFKPDWKFINQNMAKLELMEPLLIGNRLTQDLLGISLTVTEESAPNQKKYHRFLDQILTSKFINPHDPFGLSLQLRRLDMKKSRIKKVRYVWQVIKSRIIPSEFDIRLVKLPKSFFFIYYLIKPVRTLYMVLTAKRFK